MKLAAMEPYSSELLWVVICGFIVAFVLAFGIGANDVANSFGTSVGAKVLTLTQACIIASIFEVAGSVLIGYKVSDTLRKGIIDVSLYENGGERLLACGCLAALLASAIWLIVATALALPVSGTHSVVGAMVGFSITAKGPVGVRWSTLAAIVASWFMSPVLSGLASAIIYWLVRCVIIHNANPLKAGLNALPFIYGATVSINVFSVVHDGPKLLSLDNISFWAALAGSLSLGAVVALGVRLWLVPYFRKRLKSTSAPVNYTLTMSNETTPANTPTHTTKGSLKQRPTSLVSEENKTLEATEESADKYSIGTKNVVEKSALSKESEPARTVRLTPNSSAAPSLRAPSRENFPVPKRKVKIAPPDDVMRLFSFLQVLTATFGSFAHGGNDVSNAIGPLVAIWLIYSEGGAHAKTEIPISVLLYGGIGIALGLWLWGRRVIETVGEHLTKITPDSGFAIELGSALMVLVASKVGAPVSTTHCKVGAVVCVGYFSDKSVDWSLFRNIIYAWIVTVPLVATLASLIMLVMEKYCV